MPVVNSVYAVVSTQPDGSAWIKETHEISDGSFVTHTYSASAGADYSAIMAARVPTINERLASDELERLLDAV